MCVRVRMMSEIRMLGLYILQRAEITIRYVLGFYYESGIWLHDSINVPLARARGKISGVDMPLVM